MNSGFFRSVSLRSSLQELARVRAEVSSFVNGRMSEMDSSHIVLSVDEAVSNIIRHGYGENAEGVITLDMSSSAGSFEFVLSDAAPLYNPLLDHDGNEPEEGATGGFGVGVYRRFMDVRYETNEHGGNRLILKWEKHDEINSESD